MNKSLRNLVIFSVVALGGGFLGWAVDNALQTENPMQGPGVLIWLVSPLLANLLLRAFGSDGWQDAGFRLNLRGGLRWYFLALGIPAALAILLLGVGSLAGTTSLDGFSRLGLAAFFPVLVMAFAGSMIKNVFEEFAWRGYLTPRFTALGLNPYLAALFTGLVWAGWHVPYYLHFLDRSMLQQVTSLEPAALIVLALVLLPLQALLYGEIRLQSGSVWPVWLLHTLENAFTAALFTGGFVTMTAGAAGGILTPGTEGVLHALLLGTVGTFLLRRRTSRITEGRA